MSLGGRNCEYTNEGWIGRWPLITRNLHFQSNYSWPVRNFRGDIKTIAGKIIPYTHKKRM